MSDFNSSLPVRTQTNGDVVAFLADGTTPSQLLAISSAGHISSNLFDGAGTAITSQANGGQRALDVGINVAGVQIDPRAIRALTSADVVSVVQSTSPWTTKDAADGSVTGGTAGTFSQLIGGQYNSTFPTLTTGQQAAIQVDSSGRLLVGSIASALPAGSNTIGAVTQASGPWTQNLTQVGGSAIALGQTTMSASLPVTIASNQSALPVSQSGSWTVAVTQSTSPWVVQDAADGSVAPGTAATKSMLGGAVYTSAGITLTTGQQAALQSDSSGNLLVNLKTALPAGTNTIGSIASIVNALPAGTNTIGSIASITNALPAGANTIGAVNQGTSPWIVQDAADGSPTGGTAGTKSMLSGGIYNSSLPTLTTGQQASLQLDSSGRLLVDIGSEVGTLATSDAADGPVTPGTVASKSILTGGQYNTTLPTLTTGQQAALQVDSSGRLIVDLGTALPAGSNTIGSVNQGTSPWVVQDAADGSVAAGTAGTKSMLGGLVYNSAAPSLTTGQQVALQGDSAGNLLVDLKTALPAGANTIGAVTQASGPWTQNLTQVGGSAIALGQTTMSASLPVVIASNQSAIAVTGTVAVTQSTSPWVVQDAADGSVAAGTAGTKSMLGGAVYNSSAPTLTTGQQAALQSDSSGNLLVNLKTALPAGANLIGAVNLDIGSSPVSNTNPVPVTVVSTVPGTNVQNYNTSVGLAAAASVTFTYTVAATHTFNLQRVWASASGKIKALVQNNGSTIFVGFNSTANPNIDMTVVAPPTIAAGNTVTVTITNNDLQAFDVYCTIEGNQN